ncbi:MAG: membrane associated rhomboid family serine protease [Arenicella sp.]|jgi:membrane associated rhomboid family serine protease
MPFYMVVAMVVVYVVEVITPGNLSWLGIRPRIALGLIGIPASPFLHANFFHLFANALPLLVMGTMLCALDRRLFLYRTTIMIIGSGLLTWLISTSDIVVGASGLAFAYWAFLIINGIRTKKLKDISISVFTIVIYGTLLFSLFRHAPGISWAGHFSGALAGGLLAWMGDTVRPQYN